MAGHKTDARGNWHRPPGPGGGRFMTKGEREAAARREAAGTAPEAPPPPAREGSTRWAGIRGQLAKASVDQLTDAFAAISRGPAGPAMDRALTEIAEELGRREGKALTVHDTPHSRQIDELLARGWSYTDAYAEVHHLDPAKLDREQRMALVDANRRKGERRVQTLRRMYAEHVYLQWLDAEDSTRGNLLNAAGRAKGIDPVSLWSGPAARARKYASDELKAWWESHGGRAPFAVWSAEYQGDRRSTQAARQAGAGRDFGL